MKTHCILVVAVPLLLGSLMQDSSCSSRKNSQPSEVSSPAPSASVPQKRESPTPSPKSASSHQLSSALWGGNGVSLEVSDGKASLEFDCANGTISEPIMLDNEGRFEVPGLYVREGPGPVRQGGNKQSQAIYSGVVKDDTMTLSIRMDGSSDELLKVTLVRGKQGRLRKCY